MMKDFLIGIAVGALGAFVAIKVAEKEEREKIRGYIDDGISLEKKICTCSVFSSRRV